MLNQALFVVATDPFLIAVSDDGGSIWSFDKRNSVSGGCIENRSPHVGFGMSLGSRAGRAPTQAQVLITADAIGLNLGTCFPVERITFSHFRLSYVSNKRLVISTCR